MIHYGIHTDSNRVRWMYQARLHTNFVGLKTKAPIVLPNNNGTCPHNIPFSKLPIRKSHWHRFCTMAKSDPLAYRCLPMIKDMDEQVGWVEWEEGLTTHLSLLIRICSPVASVVKPLWSVTEGQIYRELEKTNIQPLILTDLQAKDRKLVTRIIENAKTRPRRLILVNGEDSYMLPVKGCDVLTTDVSHDAELMSYPLENLGAMFLRAYCQNKPVAAILESKTP